MQPETLHVSGPCLREEKSKKAMKYHNSCLNYLFYSWCWYGDKRALNRLVFTKGIGRKHAKPKTIFALILTVASVLFFLEYQFAGFYHIRFTNCNARNSKKCVFQQHNFTEVPYLTVPIRILRNDRKLKDKEFFLHIQDRKVKEINCKAIINGDANETKRASNMSASQSRDYRLSPIDYMNLASNCGKFISKRGYVMSSLTETEAEFPIAFSLLMYKDAEQAEILLRAIYRPQNVYCIHVDKKTDNDTFRVMERITNCFDNVFMARKRIDIQWGKFSVLEADLICMEELLQSNKKWKYFINLTGQEFPLRTNYEMVRILMAYNGANDIEGTIKRANKNRWQKLPPPPHNLTALKGSVKIAANRDFVDFALHNQKAKDLLEWAKDAEHPDECFFAMLNHNPSLRVRGAYLGDPETDQTNLKPYLTRFVNWASGMNNWPCHGKRVRSVCVFGAGDLPLLSTRRELFANKFYLDYERFALDCMEELHFNKTRDEYLGTSGFEYYEELGFVKNKID